MLKHRLFYGILMILFFVTLVLFDGRLDGHMPTSITGDKPVQGTIFGILIVLIIILAQLELAKLASAKNLKIFTSFTIPASVLFAGSWYWGQFIEIRPLVYVFSLSAFSLFGLLLYQYYRYGTSDVIANCGANYFSIIYIGFLIAFVVGIRIDFGLWPLLMFVFVVKSSDIGAYVTGSLFGKHKFSPNISPGKTWEGMCGGVLTAVTAALLFAKCCDIMGWFSAVIYGFCFAFIGQGGDLVESMMKRDAQQKDSSNKVPGFGGILDVIDSPLLAAPFSYLFFMFAISE